MEIEDLISEHWNQNILPLASVVRPSQ